MGTKQHKPVPRRHRHLPVREASDGLSRLRRLLAEASPADVLIGRRWYAEAYEISCSITPRKPSAGAGVLAALSPRCQWIINIVRAILATRGDFRGLTHPADKARRILQGEHPLDVLVGPKERAFYSAILSCGKDNGPAVIDIWASRAAGLSYPTTTRAYDYVSQIYAMAAGEWSWPIHEMQAVVWTTYRRRFAMEPQPTPCLMAWEEAQRKLTP